MTFGASLYSHILTLALVGGVFTAVPKQAQVLTDCTNGTSDNATIAACTAALADQDLTQAQRVAALLARGLAEHRLHHLAAAANDFDAVLQIDAENKSAHLDRGSVEYDEGDFRKALEDHTIAAGIEPRDDDASLVAIGRDEAEVGGVSEGIDNFDLVLRRNPQYEAAYVARGEAFLDEHIAFAAMRDFTYASTLDPNDSTADVGAAEAESADGSFKDAIERYTTALQLDPNSAEAFNGRGVARLSAGDRSAALADFQKASDLAPRWSTPLFNAGLAYFDSGVYPIAYEQFELALAANPNSVQSILWAHITEVDSIVNDKSAFAAYRAKLSPDIASSHPWADLLALFNGNATVDSVLSSDSLLAWNPLAKSYVGLDDRDSQCTTLALVAEWQLAHTQRAAAIETFERAQRLCDESFAFATEAVVVSALNRLHGTP